MSVKDKHAAEGDVNPFPEHLDDPQNTLSLGGVRVAEKLRSP